MILAALGTHPQPMDRLVLELARLVGTGAIAGDVIVQAARFEARPPGLQLHGVVSAARLAAWMRDADAVITHGGPGTIAAALDAGHAPIVVPRDPAHGEHVDDHQVRFATWLAARRPIRVVREMPELAPAIADLTAGGRGLGAAAASLPAQAIEHLRRIIDGS